MLDTLTNTLGLTDVTAALSNFNFCTPIPRTQIMTNGHSPDHLLKLFHMI